MKTKFIFIFLIFSLTALACNIERIIDPSLPTSTPINFPDDTPQPISPTITPISTPLPGERILTGDKALWYGDWDKALSEYKLAFESNNDPAIKSAALLGLGRAYYSNHEYNKSLENLTILITTYPKSNDNAQAFYFIGKAYDALGKFDESTNAYQEYINLRPGLIDYYVLVAMGDSYYANQDYENAISIYQQALSSTHIGDSLGINILIGNSYLELGDFNTAGIIYLDVLERSNNDFTKAQMLFFIGQTFEELGELNTAYSYYQVAVEKYPVSYYSYLSLIELVEKNISVADLNRGLVDYYASQYGVAVAAFDRYLNSNPDTHTDTAHFYKGLSYQKIGDYESAIQAWEQMVLDHPNDTNWANGIDEISFTQWFYLNQPEEAINTIENFVSSYPQHPQSPELLYFAARIAERYGDLPKAASLWNRIGSQYSTTTNGYEGFFQSGIAYYRMRDYSKSLETFQSALGIAADGTQQAAAYFWMGKSQYAQNNIDEANGAWRQAITSDPTGYYSERAADITNGIPGFTTPNAYSFNINIEQEKPQAEQWLISTFNVSDETITNSLNSINSDSRLIRGTELWSLGLYNEARIEFESLRIQLSSNPIDTYNLANYLIDLGLYRSGIIATRTILDLAGLDDATTFSAPKYFNYIRFGSYFEDIVIPASNVYNIDPLLLFSLMRQESLFEGFVTSAVGARGLMQIMPATGQGIYEQSGWPTNFFDEDLYRPIINITYGTDYLSDQHGYFNSDIYAALAAYNGGSGNSANWLSISDGDPDLFVEVIRFSETRRYLKSIYEQYVIYRNLYLIP